MKNFFNVSPLRALFLVTLADQIGITLTFPVLVFVFTDMASSLFAPDTPFAIRTFWYGVAVSIASISQIIITPVMGYLSDVYGRKKLLLISTYCGLFFALGSACGILAGSLILVLISRFIGGHFARNFSVAHAVVGDISDRQNKPLNMAHLQLVIGIGTIIGPFLGGYLTHGAWFNTFNFSFPFLVDAALACCGVFILWFLFQETNVPRQNSRDVISFKGTIEFLRDSRIARLSLMLVLGQFCWSIYFTFIGVLLKTQFSFSPFEVGLFQSSVAVGLAITNIFGVRYVLKYFNFQQVIRYASLGMVLGLLATDVLSIFHASAFAKYAMWGIGAPVAMFDMIIFIAMTTLFSNAVPSASQGKAMGVCFSVIFVTWAATAFMSGILMGIHPLLPFVVAPLGSFLLFMVASENFVSATETQPTA